MGYLAETLVQALLPARCLVCRASLPVASRAGVCARCWESLPPAPEPACEACGEPSELSPCLSCRTSPPPWRRLAAVFAYEGAARQLVLLLKSGHDELAGPLAERLVCRAQALGVPRNATVTSVPMRFFRRLSRGYNQAELLAEEVAKRGGWAKSRLLRRVGTGSQKGRNRKSRLEQVAHAFVPRGKAPERVVLVDDVVTTGATATACTRALLRAGARDVWVLALAKALKR